MEALRFIQKIEGNTITQDELLKYRGQDVEVIVFPVHEPKGSAHAVNRLRGSIKSDLDGLRFQEQLRSEWDN